MMAACLFQLQVSASACAFCIDIQSPEFMKYLERGEREAFQQLFETYHKALCFFAARIVRDHSEAEDIVQDVFTDIWNSIRYINK